MDVSDEGKQWLCITQLPDDLLCLIYRKLNELCDQRSFSLTSNRFDDVTIFSCKCLDGINSTELRKSFNPLDSFVLGRYPYCFRHYESPSSLSVLNLSFGPITDNGLEMLTKFYNKSLINVDLTCCLHITNTGISFLKQNCPQLRVLKIVGCDNVIGVASQQGFPETLTYLEANSCVLNPAGFLSGGAIDYLKVYHRNNFNQNQLGLASIGSCIAKNLKILCFCGASFVTDECILKISKGCPFLQELSLGRCGKIGFRGWFSIGLHCQNLVTLHVNYAIKLCDRGLLVLVNCCKLSVFYMTNCPQITSVGKHKFMIQRPDVKIKETRGIPCFPRWTQY